MSETLDDVLKIAAESGKEKKKPTKASLPSSSNGAARGKGLFDEDEGSGDGLGVMAMGSDDIMQYIQQNQASGADDDLELF